MFYLFQPIGRLSLWEDISRWYEDSLLKELLDHINQRWFTIDLQAYEYIPVNETTAGTLRTLILGFTLGMILAAIFIFVQKRVFGTFVKRLCKEECFSREAAKTLSELGAFRSSLLRREWRKKGPLFRYVRCVEEEDFLASVASDGGEPARYRPDFSNMHFYIPEEQRYTAEVRYEKKGSGLGSLLLVTACSILLAALLCIFLPDLLHWADRLIAMTAP